MNTPPLTNRQASRLAARCAIVDAMLGNNVEFTGIYSDGCSNGWKTYVDVTPNAHLCEISHCFRAELLPANNIQCLACEPAHHYFGSRKRVQAVIQKALHQLEKIAAAPIHVLAESIYIKQKVNGEQVRKLTIDINPIDLSELPPEGPESHRVLRRLHFLREWSHEQEQQVFP